MEMLDQIKGIDVYLLDQFLKGRLAPGMKVLDAGCGSGRNIRWLLRQGLEVWAMDANAEAIASLQSSFPEREDRFQVGRLEAYAPPLPFDFVICNAVLHFAQGHAHFEAMFASLVKALAPGGLLFIRMTSDMGLDGRLGPNTDGVYDLPDGSSRYLIDRKKVTKLLEQHGLLLAEPVKSVWVEGLRSMAVLVFQRPYG